MSKEFLVEPSGGLALLSLRYAVKRYCFGTERWRSRREGRMGLVLASGSAALQAGVSVLISWHWGAENLGSQ